MQNSAFTISGTGKVSAVIDGRAFTVETDHPNYSKIIESLKTKDWDSVIKLSDISQGIQEFVGDNVIISDGAIIYEGEVLHNTLTKRIISFMRDDLPFEPLVKFLGNLLKNPSKRAVDELYDFLEVGELPITEDGCFLAFKNVRNDYMDIHSGTKSNRIGDKPSMPRNMVDDDKNRTCSSGLHFCSISYLPHFSYQNGGHTMIVKINPADVVSIPADYNNTKGRASTYEVVAEYMDNWQERLNNQDDNGFDSQLYSSNGGLYEGDDCDDSDDSDYYEEDNEELYGFKPTGHKFYNKRNGKGQFVKSQWLGSG